MKFLSNFFSFFDWVVQVAVDHVVAIAGTCSSFGKCTICNGQKTEVNWSKALALDSNTGDLLSMFF